MCISEAATFVTVGVPSHIDRRYTFFGPSLFVYAETRDVLKMQVSRVKCLVVQRRNTTCSLRYLSLLQ